MESKQQYCLKWNNHKSNISGVFDRLRNHQRFVDVTLASADHQTIKCHRLLLSAGSGYLEKILEQNPSDHPTVVLSQINHHELSYLVEFMYTGEVAVEQEHLTKLLEAAKSLQIKGLYETSEDEDKDLKDNQPEIPPPLEDNNVTGSQKRKIRKSSENSSPKKIKVENSSPPPPPPTTSPPAPVFPSSPLFGISNAYFLNNPGLPSAPNKDPANPVTAKILQDLPKLLSQSPLPLPGNLNNSTANVCKIDLNELSNAPVRRYKQYTEDTLQQALKDIVNGQSINRSSMKYNIPARTLRDWMKRLNIKSVFTHHSQKDGRSLSSDSNDFNLEEEFRAREKQMAEKIEESSDQTNNGGVAFPGMKLPGTFRNGSVEDQNSTEEDEEEIDDDEEGTLQISSTDA